MIRLKNVSKFYYKNGIIASGISKINLEFKIGEFIAITGESGSGKSTLLNVISGLDTYEEGEMYINDMETSHFREKDFENYRRKYIGNIFQNFNLVNSYTVYQNIELVLLLNGYKKKDVKEKVNELIKKVDLVRFRNIKVSKLSGGQKQRVAIARALATETPVIIADEPTGNLDSKSAAGIIKLLNEISENKLVIIVTHNYEQVSDYVTRKIKMHDGKVLEDKVIKNYSKNVEHIDKEYNDIKLISEFDLGIRNAFNIIPKFLLLLIVFIFILIAVISEYTGFKQMEYQDDIGGYNYLFQDTSDKRIVINKKDHSVISNDDYIALNNMNNVDYIIRNDYLMDSNIYITDNDKFYVYGNFKNLDIFEGDLDYGKMPENDNEVVVVGMSYDYYIGENMRDKLMETSLFLGNDMSKSSVNQTKLKVVGIKYIDNTTKYSNTIIYGTNVLEKEINFSMNQQFSTIKILFEDKYYNSDLFGIYFKLEPSSLVSKGKAYISEDMSYVCPKSYCVNRSLTIELNNLYYNEIKSLKVSKVYNENNFKKIVGFSDYNANNGKIFINIDDYNSLFNNGPFQSSVYIKDIKKTNDTIKVLQDNGYNTLLIKDTLVKDSSTQILIIIRTVITIVLLIALFFISYFIIKLILKSRNTYFSIIRMLGASQNVARNLITIELLTIANLAFLIVISGVLLTNYNIISISMLNDMLDYLVFSDYIVLYLITIIISYLVSIRYSRKLFKNSTMVTFREEV